MPRDWDARTYDRVADPMTRWGSSVLDRLQLRGDETVLDAGCGTGRVTERLVERLPNGRIVALDGSPAMVEEARRRLERFGDRVRYVVADLMEPLPIDPVDAILSTATFHWIPDHARLFANLAAVLQPGGRLVAQCGGVGNIATVRAAADAVLGGGDTNVYPTPDETVARLAAAGFTDIRCWLAEEPTTLAPGEPFEAYLRTVVLGGRLAAVPPAARDAAVREVARRLGRPHLDYVRLNIDATRAA